MSSSGRLGQRPTCLPQSDQRDASTLLYRPSTIISGSIRRPRKTLPTASKVRRYPEVLFSTRFASVQSMYQASLPTIVSPLHSNPLLFLLKSLPLHPLQILPRPEILFRFGIRRDKRELYKKSRRCTKSFARTIRNICRRTFCATGNACKH